MQLLAFSDLHCDLVRGRALAERASAADVVAGVGDFASVHRGLEETLAVPRAIEVPVLLVPGNNETVDALRAATDDWSQATVLHGDATELDGVTFFGLGGGIPTTPWDWSFDLSEDEAEAELAGLPPDAILLVHSPPKGHVDNGLGSTAVLRAVERSRPRLVACGHVHDCWGKESRIGDVMVRNLGPDGVLLTV